MTIPLRRQVPWPKRSIRDVQAAIKHVAMTPISYGLVGRVKLGLPLGTTRF
ncbi:hypothetical protein ACE10Z_19040 [Bradyrhizobium sp. Pha-3]|uniref:hypothetical protein n=1 Tax=Bradyrhizobium sp. Pha-3 TaxID=208375 RepID=UPI0035D41EDA